jgi:hypothetical protein
MRGCLDRVHDYMHESATRNFNVFLMKHLQLITHEKFHDFILTNKLKISVFKIIVNREITTE